MSSSPPLIVTEGSAPAFMAWNIRYSTNEWCRGIEIDWTSWTKRNGSKLMALPFLACMVAAAAWYHLPPRVLPAIQSVEGGRPGMVSHNTDGSEDLGPMQVNSSWTPRFAALVKQPEPLVRARLIYDPCFNIAAAGAIMRVYLNEAHGDLLVAVGWYHSHTPERSMAYRDQVLRAAERLFVRESQGRSGSASPSSVRRQ
jgi:soluble lytic murein transglycosylase-like protein